jgi:hypothetical protein
VPSDGSFWSVLYSGSTESACYVCTILEDCAQ